MKLGNLHQVSHFFLKIERLKRASAVSKLRAPSTIQGLGPDGTEFFLAETPGAPLYIFPGRLPNSLRQDKADIGGEQVTAKQQYTFHMRSMKPMSSSEAGEVRIVASRNFPVSKHNAAGLLIIKPAHMREMHWHPNAHLNIDKAMAQKIPAEKPYLV